MSMGLCSTSRSRRALTLVEVLVASVLLGVGVAGLMSAATLGLRNQQRADHRAAALYLAHAKLAELEQVGAHVWMLGYPTQGTEASAGMLYEWTIRIEQQPVGKLFDVLVEVGWSGPGAGQVELETWL